MDRVLDVTRLPPDVRYFSDFLSREEEEAIKVRLDAGEWSNTLKRRVQHFGYLYDYKARTVTADTFWVSCLNGLKRLAEDWSTPDVSLTCRTR